MQHAAEAVVQQGVSHMHDTEAVASQQAYEVLQNNVEHNVQQSQNIHTELQVRSFFLSQSSKIWVKFSLRCVGPFSVITLRKKIGKSTGQCFKQCVRNA